MAASRTSATREDLPAYWKVEYERGADGCLPAGWYVQGYHRSGFRTDYLYGPKRSRKQAVALKARAQLTSAAAARRNPLLGNNGREFEANAVRMKMAKDLQQAVEWQKGARPSLAECLTFIDEHGVSLMREYDAMKAADRRRSFRIVQKNPPRDPISHGLVTDPPKNASDGDTCVMASKYHPGTYEVLVFGGDVIPGKGYVEMWFLARQKMTKDHALESAAAFAS